MADAHSALQDKLWDVVVSGLEMVDAKGLDSLVSLSSWRSDYSVTAIAEGSEPDAVLNAARSLSDDCLIWQELQVESLNQSIVCAIERRQMLAEFRSSQVGQDDRSEGPSPFRAVLDKIEEAVFVVSIPDGILLFSNDTAMRWFGANIGEALEDALEYDLLEVEAVEMEISTRNANIPRAELRSLIVDWGKERACLISMRNISKQKRAEDAYLACQRRFDLAIRDSGFWSWDLTRKKVYFSEGLRTLVGDGEEEDAASKFLSILHPEDHDRVVSEFLRFEKEPKREIELDFRIRCRDGFYINVLSRGGQVSDGSSESVLFAGSILRLDEKREIYIPKSVPREAPELKISVDKPLVEKRETARGFALIVDDEEVLRKALESILLSYGFQTLVANDGAEGIELYDENHGDIEIVLPDVNMPKIDGSKVFAHIRKDGQRIPIIMTSGNDDKRALPFLDGEKENCDFLLKPFGLADVKRIVDRFVKPSVVAN